jgi:hypothetical protein
MSSSLTSTLRAADGRMLQGVEKVPAYSWVELSGKVHEFCVGDKLLDNYWCICWAVFLFFVVAHLAQPSLDLYKVLLSL